jgi:hypothetical protein
MLEVIELTRTWDVAEAEHEVALALVEIGKQAATPLIAIVACENGLASVVRSLIELGVPTDVKVKGCGVRYDGYEALNIALKTFTSLSMNAARKEGARKCCEMILKKHRLNMTKEAFSAKHVSDITSSIYEYTQPWGERAAADSLNGVTLVRPCESNTVSPEMVGGRCVFVLYLSCTQLLDAQYSFPMHSYLTRMSTQMRILISAGSTVSG